MTNETNRNDMLMSINIGNESMYLKPEEMEVLNSLDIVLDREDWMDPSVNNINEVIKVLFVLNKINLAWELIENNLDDIDFTGITSFEYFQLDRNAVKVFKYMKDNNIIDDETYAYFQVLGGKLSDIEFWKNRFNEKSLISTEQKLEELYNSFNGINPLDVGLIEESEELFNLLDLDNQKDVDLSDYIIGAKTSVFFTSNTLIKMIENNNIIKEKYHEIINLILQQYQYIGDTSDEEYYALYELAYNLLNKNFIQIKFDTLNKLEKLIKSEIFKSFDHELVCNIMINSIAFMNYPHYINQLLIKYSDFSIIGEKVSKYINPVNYPYVLTYKLLDILDTDDFIIKYPFPSYCNMIFNKDSNILFINGRVFTFNGNAKDFKESIDEYVGFDILSFVVNSIKDFSHSEFLTDLHNNVSSDEELHEILLSLSSMIVLIMDTLIDEE